MFLEVNMKGFIKVQSWKMRVALFLVLALTWRRVRGHEASITHNTTSKTMKTTPSVVINTWSFIEATSSAMAMLKTTDDGLSAVVAGASMCEKLQCDHTVGFGGSPDSEGETTLDAMVMDGNTMAVGAVGYLRRVKNAIQVAHAVLVHSSHSILVGKGALDFAKMMGFEESSLETDFSKRLYQEWRANKCQPNYFRSVVHQADSCPPFHPMNPSKVWGEAITQAETDETDRFITFDNHDTIGIAGAMFVVFVAGASSNGANHKIAGRIGDAAIAGAGSYADSDVGGAAATGDGDVMMRFLPSFQAVKNMQAGMNPQEACENALLNIARKYPSFKGGMVCLSKTGEYGGAGHGWDFSYTVQTSDMVKPVVNHVQPITV